MLQQYQDRMEALGIKLEQFADQFSEEHPGMSHQIDDVLTHLKKSEKAIEESLSEWGAYGELRKAELESYLEGEIGRFEALLKDAIAKF